MRDAEAKEPPTKDAALGSGRLAIDSVTYALALSRR